MKGHEVTLIGSGNVAFHLGQAFLRAGIGVDAVCSRTPAHAAALAAELGSRVLAVPGDIPDRGIVLIAATDDAIAPIAEGLALREALLLHTSGSVPMELLARGAAHYGVLYPLQTFSRDRPVNLRKVPLLLEASGPEEWAKLKSLAAAISGDLREVNSAERHKYHLAAVMANNFVNHLLAMSAEFLEKEGLDFDVLYPLIRETVDKAIAMGPGAAQTGPARRGDEKTMERHLAMIRDPLLETLYRLLSEHIRNHYR